MTWFDGMTGLRDLGWHEVAPTTGGVRRFERDEAHPLGFWELTRVLSDIAIAYNLGEQEATIRTHDRIHATASA